MIKKTISYEDFNGIQRVEDFFFHISKAELLDLENSVDGGLQNHLMTLSQLDSDTAENRRKIIEEFKKLIKVSFGTKSDDGKRFIKNAENWGEFSESEAYSNLIVELLTVDGAAVEFANGIMPKGLDADIERAAFSKSSGPEGIIASPDGAHIPHVPLEQDVAQSNSAPSVVQPKYVTSDKIMTMDAHALRKGLADGSIIIQG